MSNPLPTLEESQQVIDKALKERDGDAIRQIKDWFRDCDPPANYAQEQIRENIYAAWTNIKLKRFATDDNP